MYQLPLRGRGSPVRFYSAPGTSCTSSHCGDAGALLVSTQPQGLCDPAPLAGTREPLTKFSEHLELWINPPSVSSNCSPAAAGENLGPTPSRPRTPTSPSGPTPGRAGSSSSSPTSAGRSRDFVYQLPLWGCGSPVRFYSAPGTL